MIKTSWSKRAERRVLITRFHRGYGLKVILTVSSFIVSLLAAEAILRWFDLMDPPVFESNQQYGYMMRPHQSVSTRGYRFWINQAGFRGPDFEVNKPADIFRIDFLGDSITYGGGRIADKDLFVNRVAQRLSSISGNRVESINLSMPAWGVRNMAGYVAAKGLHEANLLVWVISSSDFRRPMTTLEGNGFEEIASPSRLLNGIWIVLLKIVGTLRHPAQDGVELPSGALEKNVEVLHTALAALKIKGIPILVVLVPAATGYGPPEDLMKFRSAAESVSVPVLDTGPAFSGIPSDLLFFDGVHLTQRGHEVVADSITSSLQKHL